MSHLQVRLACLDLAEFVLEDAPRRGPGLELTHSAEALALATTIHDAIDAWHRAQAGDPDEAIVP